MDTQVLRPPAAISFINNPAEKWIKFKQKFNLFLKASGKSTEAEDVKIAILLTTLGDEGIEIYNTFQFKEKDENGATVVLKLEDVIKKFDEYTTPLKNVTFETFKFQQIAQKEGQSFDNFLTELKTQAAFCDFNCSSCKVSYEERMVKDNITLKLKDKNVQQKLLKEPKLKLEEIVEFCRIAEVGRNQFEIIEEKEIDIVKQHVNSNQICQNCGYKHKYDGFCPAKGKTCAKCGKINHFANVCSFKAPERNKLHEVSDGGSSSKKEDSSNVDGKESDVMSLQYGIFTVMEDLTMNEVSSWSEDIQVNSEIINFKLDSGAEISTLPLSLARKICKLDDISPIKLNLVAYGGYKLKCEGMISLVCSSKNVSNVLIKFAIINENAKPLLGLNACIKLNLIKKIDSLNNYCKDKNQLILKYKNCFDGLGEMPGLHHISVQDNYVGFVFPRKNVPFALHERLKLKLTELEKQNIIEKVDHPTDFVHNLVVVEKPNGSLRLCLDPKYLNLVVKREHFSIPTCEDITSRLAGKKYFTVIDMKDGFYQIKLDESSSDLCTFNTPFGRFKFLRLPFGLCSAPELFQKKNMEIFGDISNVEIYFDDLIVSGSTEEEHDLALMEVFKKAETYNVKFNSKKLQFKLKEVNFMGLLISESGLSPDEKHAKAIKEMPNPTNKTELLKVLGIFKYLCKFIPNLSAISAPLRELTKDGVEFSWNKAHDKALTELKEIICKSPVLKIFDNTKPILIQTDASKLGLGTNMSQEGHTISYRSRALNKSEEKYAQIEKELLAIVFAAEKFHQFIYGQKVTINTDHKPLVSIFKKDINKVSARLQRMLLKLLKYDLTVEYVPGKSLYIADTLSRLYLKEETPEDPEMAFVVHNLVNLVPMSQDEKKNIQNWTKEDNILKFVLEFQKTNWPDTTKNLCPEMKQYFKIKDDIFVSDDILFLNNKLIVPPQQRRKILHLLHEGHFGVEKTRLAARNLFYWPNMSKEIEDFVLQCEICEKFRRKNQKEPLTSHPLPERPWERISADILEYGNRPFLVVFDSYSNWLELALLKGKSAENCIEVLKTIFARFGVPDYFLSDNNPFNSFEFKNFANEWNFNLINSSPRYPQSNGLAEKGVSIVKQIMRKLGDGINRENISLALLNYRITPLPGMGFSPSQLLMGRVLKSRLPVTKRTLQPQICDQEIVEKKLMDKKLNREKFYNQSAKSLPRLKENEMILLKKENSWVPAIVKKSFNDHSYLVEDEYGTIYRRNRIFLRQRSANNLKRIIDQELFIKRDSETHNRNLQQTTENCTDLTNYPGNSNDLDSSLNTDLNNSNYSTPCTSPNNSTDNSNYITRSGRHVNKPIRFNDYV